MVDVAINLFTGRHSVKGRRPMFYALQQLACHLDGYDRVTRVDTGDDGLRLYLAEDDDPTALPAFWTAWHDPGELILRDDAVPSATLDLAASTANVEVEELITGAGQTEPDTSTVPVTAGVASITLTPRPVFIIPLL